jgi:hypothetical protein
MQDLRDFRRDSQGLHRQPAQSLHLATGGNNDRSRRGACDRPGCADRIGDSRAGNKTPSPKIGDHLPSHPSFAAEKVGTAGDV